MQIILVVFASQKVAHYFMLYYEYYGNKCPTFFFQIEKRKEKQETYHCWKNIYFQRRKFPPKSYVHLPMHMCSFWTVKNSIIVQINNSAVQFVPLKFLRLMHMQLSFR